MSTRRRLLGRRTCGRVRPSRCRRAGACCPMRSSRSISPRLASAAGVAGRRRRGVVTRALWVRRTRTASTAGRIRCTRRCCWASRDAASSAGSGSACCCWRCRASRCGGRRGAAGRPVSPSRRTATRLAVSARVARCGGHLDAGAAAAAERLRHRPGVSADRAGDRRAARASHRVAHGRPATAIDPVHAIAAGIAAAEAAVPTGSGAGPAAARRRRPADDGIPAARRQTGQARHAPS